jgi:IS30 family transposase
MTTGGSSVVSKRLSRTERDEVTTDFRSGTLIRLIAEKYGVSRSTIQRLLRMQGLGRYDKGSA